jgi:hypothetical protein
MIIRLGDERRNSNVQTHRNDTEEHPVNAAWVKARAQFNSHFQHGSGRASNEAVGSEWSMLHSAFKAHLQVSADNCYD